MIKYVCQFKALQSVYTLTDVIIYHSAFPFNISGSQPRQFLYRGYWLHDARKFTRINTSACKTVNIPWTSAIAVTQIHFIVFHLQRVLTKLRRRGQNACSVRSDRQYVTVFASDYTGSSLAFSCFVTLSISIDDTNFLYMQRANPITLVSPPTEPSHLFSIIPTSPVGIMDWLLNCISYNEPTVYTFVFFMVHYRWVSERKM